MIKRIEVNETDQRPPHPHARLLVGFIRKPDKID